MPTDYLTPILERTRRTAVRREELAPCLGVGPSSTVDLALRTRAALMQGEPGVRLIAEVKFRSPSAGSIRSRRAGDSVRIASTYASAGASAVSVLADGPGFGGSPLDVRRVARAVSVPVLYKGFVLRESQLRLARATGAAMALLLVRALEAPQLKDLVQHAEALGIVPLVEAADCGEVEIALSTGAWLIGVNARNLSTFKVDPVRAYEALAWIPEGYGRVAMSGVKDRDDVLRARDAGAHAVLVGESLMRSHDPAALVRRLLGSD